MTPAAACTRKNPDFQGGDGGTLADLGSCVPGERACTGARSMVCGSDKVFHVDRDCPTGSRCQAGACQPVGSPERCRTASDCGGDRVCTVFVDPAAPTTLATFCSVSFGGRAGGERCTANGDCQSGLCVGARPSAVCFLPCTGEGNACPGDLKCEDVSVTVDGVRDSERLKGCVPRR